MDNWTGARVILGMLGAVNVPLAAQSAQTAPRVRGVSFAYAGYKAGGSLSLYLAQRIGSGMVLTGAVGNTETGYRAFIIGGGTHLRLSASAGLTALVAGASTTDGPSARLYLLPKVTAGSFVVSATAAANQPLGGESRRWAAIDHDCGRQAHLRVARGHWRQSGSLKGACAGRARCQLSSLAARSLSKRSPNRRRVKFRGSSAGALNRRA
jgi:hypothetical protein